jgi:hypothetical protein
MSAACPKLESILIGRSVRVVRLGAVKCCRVVRLLGLIQMEQIESSLWISVSSSLSASKSLLDVYVDSILIRSGFHL